MAHVGSTPCILKGCGGEMAVSHSTTGVRNVKCPRCGFSGFGGAGSKAAKLIDQATERSDDEPTAAPPPAASPALAVKASKAAGTLLG
jgi:hypothetical protein